MNLLKKPQNLLLVVWNLFFGRLYLPPVSSCNTADWYLHAFRQELPASQIRLHSITPPACHLASTGFRRDKPFGRSACKAKYAARSVTSFTPASGRKTLPVQTFSLHT
ncbi:MAG: hypothetical protein PF590_06060 [Candidatus Delongbacteria bacterium]|jgi:hypothetical protein|nr:hypothetical protein [Candidatus Delongbacteria bacterium]